MSKNREGRRRLSFLTSVLACLLFTMIPLLGCAKTKTHSNGSDASDGFGAQDEGSAERLSDAGATEEENDASFAWDSDTVSRLFPADAVIIPRDIPEQLTSLTEPDFAEPIEALAEQRCGYVFTAESVASTEAVASRAVETRAFDAEGRLIAAEIRIPLQEREISNSYLHFRRLQIEYDDAGRPTLVRISPIENNGGIGTVIDIAYQDDGSSTSQMITDDIWYFGDPLFCETLQFDAHGNLTKRAWGCNNEVVVQTRGYDDRQRPLFDEKTSIADLDIPEYKPEGWSGSREQWRIDFFYDDENNQSSAVWKERPDGWFPNDLIWQFYEDVEQRLIKTYDESGQLMNIEFDSENDDTIDERTTYTYRDSELLSVETDFWVDGIVDIIEIHDRSSNRHRIEQRNMTANRDSRYFFRTVPRFSYRMPLMDITAIPPIQSQAITDIIYNDQMKIAEIVVEENTLYSYYPDATSMETESVPVSATWRETREYADRGYVKHKEVVWQPSERYLEAIDRDQDPNNWQLSPLERFRYTDNQTTCALKPLCDTAEVVLPEEMRYLTCDVGIIFPEYHTRSVEHGLRRPVINVSGWYYAVPPYDTVPGMQNALRSDGIAKAVPAPPVARDILDY